MESRITKLIVGAAGGTAGKNSKTYKISIPSKWVKELDLENNNVEIFFDGNCITIKPEITFNDFIEYKKSLSHKLLKINVFNNDSLCSTIIADYTDHTVKHENYTDYYVKTPFGNNNYPDFSDYRSFLEERCIPKERSGIREYLNALDIDYYDPLEIIKKTNGVMAEDDIHLELEELQ